MVPYVRMSFRKHFRDGMKWIEHADMPQEIIDRAPEDMSIEDESYKRFKNAYDYAVEMTTKETYQAAEGLYHNLNSLKSRGGGQLPFTSLNYGTCTLPEGRLVINALLDNSIKGVGKLHIVNGVEQGFTPIFPCGIFQLGKGINRKKGDPNYDLFRKALRSTAKRLYPNYANVDWSSNAGYDPDDPKTIFSTMGALAGHEHLYIRINDRDPIDISIKDLFYMLSDKCNANTRIAQIYYNKKPLNIPTNADWRKNQIRYDSGIKAESGVYKVTYVPQDVSYIGSSKNIQQRIRDHKKNIRHTGGLDCGLFFGDNNVDNYVFEVIEYTDDYQEAEKKYIQTVPNANFKGIYTKYYKNVGITKGRGSDTRPLIKMNPDVPQEFISLEDCNYKVLDKDNKWVKIKHIFKNDKMNTPLMMHISYKEHDKTYTLCCTEDHPLWNGTVFVRADKLHVGDKLYRADGLALEIVEIKYNTERTDSYDIGTETGSFIGSDIIMHNCRTANLWDANGFGQLKDGRGNICPVTIILPTLAMMSGGDVEKFMNLLDQKIHEAKDQLIERFEHICKQPVSAAKFMWENNMMAGFDGVTTRSALKHGTLAIGQLGLAEALQILVGCDHTEAKGMELAKRIEALFQRRCKEFKAEEHTAPEDGSKYYLNFGVYYSPSESLCYTAMQKFKQKYGVIPNVSENEFFTNSMHVPVWKEISIFDKIDIEAQLTGYSSAGCITYIELDSSATNNIDALEAIVNYAMDKDIPYFAINIPNDQCKDCGFTGDFNDCCPACGSKDIKQLRRVTGYLSGDYRKFFNLGKQQEVQMRFKHSTKK